MTKIAITRRRQINCCTDENSKSVIIVGSSIESRDKSFRQAPVKSNYFDISGESRKLKGRWIHITSFLLVHYLWSNAFQTS